MQHRTKKYKVEVDLKIAIVGDSHSGKSSLIRFLTNKPFIQEYEQDQTYSLTLHSIKKKDTIYNLEFWDCGSCHLDNNDYIRTAFFRDSSAVIITYDLSKDNFLDRVPTWVDQCHKNTCYLLYAAGTKRDLVEIQTKDKEMINQVMKDCKLNSLLYSFKQQRNQNGLQKLVGNIVDSRNEIYRSKCGQGQMYIRRTLTK